VNIEPVEESYSSDVLILTDNNKYLLKIPFSDAELLSKEEIENRLKEGNPLEFGHTLDDQIGGQIAAGFVITGFYEDKCEEKDSDLLSQYISTFIATRAVKR